VDEFDIAVTIYWLWMIGLMLARRSRYEFTFAFDHRGDRVEVNVRQIPPSKIQEYYDAADELVAEIEVENEQWKGKGP
jgi:hypothetical protein